MRTESDFDPTTLTMTPSMEIGDLRHTPGPPIAIGNVAGQPKDCGSDHRAGASGQDGIGHCILEEVHLARGGDVVSKKFCRRQRHTPIDVFWGEARLPRPEHLTPAIE
jgi:hypothetical protein